MRWTATLAVGLLVLSQSSAADYFAIAFEGVSLKKVESSLAATFETPLETEHAIEYQVRILERNGTYYWASRNMRSYIAPRARLISPITQKMGQGMSE